ncbi:DNA cytosine methyltransferase [Caulobacter sp. RHG1]|uniref:DNA cytosine methyltransferase n=1 Tax=Caulobacter sp. (strain RHG1) TaxID=2545762 RepID=UPI0015569838|nr:DNA cytosine methyltransferase [Caulobacter sp. RHG1]NQE62900.1 hypothetical protein [Caulobacter sp. RHG1]
MSRPRLLDLFSCAGGAAKGYQLAGFHVTSVDIERQPRCTADEFVQANAVDLKSEWVASFDAIHASPPCQFGSELTPANARGRHLNLIPLTREILRDSGRPYVIENVRAARAHLISPVSLFGTMFDMHMVTSAGRKYVLTRERLFETNWDLSAPADLGPQGHPIANIYGGHLRCRSGEHRTGKGTGRTMDFPGEDRPALARQLMQMPWASMGEMSEAVPPPFTEHIGRQLRAILQLREAA